LKGMDLAQETCTRETYAWNAGRLDLDRNVFAQGGGRFKVVAYDFGIKLNILRLLAERGCDLTVVPARTPASEVLAMRPDGVLLGNGPGDPAACDYAIAATRELLAAKLPLYGICLGHQLLGLALGAHTVEMKFGHHGANHPVIDLDTGRVLITSQNHGFAVDEATLPANVRVTHRSLFDGSNQGIALTDTPAFSFQGHPEASPGPHDVAYLFDRFIASMEARRNAQAHRHQDRPDHRRRPVRHRPGLRIRLFRRAGLQGAARRGLPGRAGELEPGHDHDRPGHGRRGLHRADQPCLGGEDHRQGAPGRAAADDGRADRAQLRAGPGRPRRARAVRGRADRRLARRDPHGRGPRAVQAGDGRDRAGVPEGRS